MQSTAIKDYVSKIHLVLNPNMDVLEAIGKLVNLKVTTAPVVDNQGNIVGLLTEHGCLNVALQSGYFAEAVGKVADFMDKEVRTIEADGNILDLAAAAHGEQHQAYMVLEENRLIGHVGYHEMLKALMTLRGTG